MITNDTTPIFKIGICMAGAVSAGAYTAGVMDYLLEALEAYEQQRGQPGVPSHKIEIPVIGGASAGGMTALITAAALQQGITPVKAPNANIQDERKENILYHSWVDLTDKDMFARMLKNDDIDDAGVVSAFNCTFIDEVASRTITPVNTNNEIKWQKLPDFFPDRLKLFTTISNLEGYTYDVSFKSGGGTGHHPYYMQFHNDYACFEMNREGVLPSGKGWMPLDIEKRVNTTPAMEAAMATGAFPVGLKARVLSRTKEVAENNPFFDEETRKAIKIEQDPYIALNVDGGMINNEPFDKVRELLLEETDQAPKPGEPDMREYEDFAKFKSTVLMIAPFPSKKPDAITIADKLLHVVGLTLSAMITQMRSKPAQVKDAMDENCAGQYLIDPSRKVIIDGKETTIQGEKAIACGALGGFSGFINKEFRIHDYFLGRHNCKVFLKEYFTIPDAAKNENPIFAAGYNGITDTKYQAKDGSWQIIPIVDYAAEYTFPELNFTHSKNWPKQKDEAVDRYSTALKERVQAVILNITDYKIWVKVFLWPGVRFILRGLMANAVIKTIKKEFKDWDLL
jgi:hypothetical protein